MLPLQVEAAKELVAKVPARIVGVWVGVASLEGLTDLAKKSLGEGASDKEVGEEVSRLVEEIEWGVTSGVFEFTVLEDTDEARVEDVKKVIKYL
ncbi:hypothetical protein TeGR_g6247 [Tetraparma gracilis]|uniref:Luciferase-like domain-containing protein n=1 Tax=Tetraparma gracilis TaxID=2962635 RepID=A0ABQ6MGT4_9STRA|nr:hypothetical protein TeGR_g6247 [Tetraparma gracilis]